MYQGFTGGSRGGIMGETVTVVRKVYKKDKDGLSPKESEFCRGVSKGENPSAAYRRIWEAESAKPHSIHVASSRLIKRAEVQRRLSTLQAQISASFVNKTASKAVEDKELVLSKLRQIINEEITVKSEVIRSLELLGRTQALFSDTIVTKESEASSEDLAVQIAAILDQANDDSDINHDSSGDEPVH
tara:strand:- start:591 stop:1151 length:561 start_codon:yes stop_codon:yes gene_type:complete